MTKIGLVTVLFNSDPVLPGFFESISRQRYKDYILYIIDNDPNPATDQVIDRCKAAYPVSECKHIRSTSNVGVAEGNNIGIRIALEEHCSHLLILNNDIEIVQDDAFDVLLAAAENKGAALVVPKILYYDSRAVWMAGGSMNKWRALGVHYGYNKPDGPAYGTGRYITYAPTCYMLVERRLFDEIGMMDARYFAYYDDTDFVYRAMEAGHKMYYEPSITVLHKVSSSTGNDSSFYVYYSNRNKIYFIRKNLKGLVKPVAIVYTLFTRLFYYLRFNPVMRRKLVKAISDGFKLPL